MRVGTLEIQLLAGMARLQKDMNDAQRMVGGAMGNVERSVASAKRAMQTLGVGLPIAAITDQVRRMSDQYTKLDAQIRLATKSQAAYAQGMADIRRISTTAQADISATSMLYTRLINTMEGTGIAQSKLATVTETISFGLKAYGATTQEAASAALQLSQAMGANRLGGEEFRAVMEAMPNVMKVLADSMGVPLGQLRQLSIDGKITADEMVKAFGNPAVAAQFKALAESTQTVTGAWQVARNELMLLVGEFTKSSGLTQSTIAGFNAFAAVFRFMADNLGILTNALLAYTTVMAGKFVVGLAQARMAQIAANAAAAEAAIANVAVAESAMFAAKANLAGAAAAARAGGSMSVASVAAKEYAASVAALAAAEKAQAASSIGIAGRIKGAVGKAGWIGMALFGAWTVYDFLNGMQQVADGADKLKNKFEGMTLAEVQMARQRELVRQIGMRGMFQDNAAIQNSQDMIRSYDQQIAKMVELQNAETNRTTARSVALTGDAAVMQARFDALAKELGVTKTQAEYETAVLDLYGQGAKAAKVYAKEQSALAKERKPAEDYLASLREEIALHGLNAEAVARYNAEKAGGNVIQQEQAAADAKHLEYLKDAQKQAESNDAIRKRAEERAAQRTQDAIDEQQRAHEEMWKSIEGAAHDTWTRIWTEGSNAFQNIGKTIKSAILDLLYQMTVKQWIIGVSMSASGGALGGGALGGGGLGGGGLGGGGLGSWVQAGQSLWSAFSGGMTGTLGSLAMGAGEMFGSAALTSFGQGMSSVLGAGVAGPTMAGAGGAAGFGASVGAALPWVAGGLAIGSALGIFGGSKGIPTQSTSDVTQGYAGAKRVSQTQGRFGGTGGAATLDALASNIAQLTTALGGTAGRQTLFFGSNTGGRGNNYTPEFRLAGAGYNSTTANAGTNLSMTAETVARESARVVVSALQQSNLPKYLKDFFNTLTPAKMSEQDVNNALAYAQALKQTRDALTETRTPLEILRANVVDISKQLKTSAATYKADFVKAIDKALTPEMFAKWGTAGQMLDALAQAEAQLAGESTRAAQQIKDAWQSITDTLFSEVARIRGLNATPGATAAQFATATAMARAGDQEAAKSLVGISQAMLTQAEATSASALELARIRAYVAGSLETTAAGLSAKYGTQLPSSQSPPLGIPTRLASFAVGTAEVPQDMVAQIHKGERITPKPFVDETNTLLADLRNEARAMRLELADIKTTNRRMWQTEEKWDVEGAPEVRTV